MLGKSTIEMNTKEAVVDPEKKAADLFYVPLIPKDDIDVVDKDRAYTDLLDIAIKTNGVKNIAVTGAYGSGKSSIISAYLKNKTTESKKYVKISLATFEEKNFVEPVPVSIIKSTVENPEKDKPKAISANPEPKQEKAIISLPTKKTEIQNEDIERSILKQLFYSVEANEIPNSRFRKIKDTNNKKKFFLSLIGSIFSFSLLILFFIGAIKRSYDKLSFVSKNEVVKFILLGFSLLIILCVIGFFVWQIINLFDKGKELKKIKLSELETEVESSSSSSIFNLYLEEILYFFKKTETKIVIFEDLDRFNSVEIFINLRELNTLLNSHLKNDKIIFVYAIKDDMFVNYDRTKFFDYIVPIIPVISSYNSAEMAIKKVKGTIYENVLCPDFLNEVMPYVDDYRTLDNIFNEFKLYNAKFKKLELSPQKLLCMMIYKNLHPQDFALLNNNKGWIYTCFQNFRNVIEAQKPELIEEREKIVSYLNNNSKEYMDLLEYKRNLFMRLAYAEGKSYIKIQINSYNDKNINLDEFMRSDFDLNKINNLLPINENNNLSIVERYKAIEAKAADKLTEYENKLHEIRQKIAELSALTLQEYITQYNINDKNNNDVFNDEIRKHPMIVKFLSKGFIDETYHSYITNNYFENLTRNDFCFVDAVKCYKKLSPKFELVKIENILKELNRNDFKKKEILNYYLIQYLLQNKKANEKHSEFLAVLFKQLSDGSEESLTFIDSFYDFSSDKETYIKEMFTTVPLIWQTINEAKSFEESRKLIFIKLIIETCDVDSLKIMNGTENIKNIIENNNQIIGMFGLGKALLYDKDKAIFIINNFKGLNIKFKAISKDLIDNTLNKLICHHKLFEINSEMIMHVLQTYDMPFKEAQQNNYQQIIDCKSAPLKDYIDQNMQQYVDSILLPKLTINESQETLKDFLTRTTITEESKEKIISKVNLVLKSLKVSIKNIMTG